jgi:rhomboid protease GluP
MKCPRCEGSGKCVDCKGTGKARCVQCAGAGSVTIEISGAPKTNRCSICKGEGTVACSPLCDSCAGSGEITSELQKSVRQKYQPSWERIKEQMAVVSFALLILILICFIATSMGASLGGHNTLFNLGALVPWLVVNGEWWRVLTALFLHVNLWHFLMNAYCLFIICPPIEKIVGSPRFLALYLVSGVAGNLLSMLLLPMTPSVGASGALFGVLGAYFGLNYRYKLFQPSSMQQLVFWLVLNVVIGLTPGLNINIWAHLGGLIGGFIFSTLIKLK